MIILLTEKHQKPVNYPLAKVIQVVKNDIGEVTEIVALLGSSRRQVKRHVTYV